MQHVIHFIEYRYHIYLIYLHMIYILSQKTHITGKLSIDVLILKHNKIKCIYRDMLFESFLMYMATTIFKVQIFKLRLPSHKTCDSVSCKLVPQHLLTTSNTYWVFLKMRTAAGEIGFGAMRIPCKLIHAPENQTKLNHANQK